MIAARLPMNPKLESIPQKTAAEHRIPFNKPCLVGNELDYIQDCIKRGHISGNGTYTKKCERFFEEQFGFHKALMTSSCTDALEMTALLIDLQPGDEVIIPSFTFVSTANAYVLRGAKIIFADSESITPNLDVSRLEALITPKTRAIVAVHYAGMACDMNALCELTRRHNLFLVEDAAHAIGANYKDKPLGGFGQMSTFSFHETKNIIAGEGGMLVINDPALVARAEILREKGTDRMAFFRGQVDKYTWQDVGSSFLPADYVAAFLWGQLECFEQIQNRRLEIWRQYQALLSPFEEQGYFRLPRIPEGATNNAHMFYLLCNSQGQRAFIIDELKKQDILAVFHYLPLHDSPYYQPKHDGRDLPNTAYYADHLLRLPLYYDLQPEQVTKVAQAVMSACERFKPAIATH
ncbi:MAG TPA: dTDP-4-amino-4,6-dideoxygalactose transaminase [Coleofasciculaceae cyanobacterium]